MKTNYEIRRQVVTFVAVGALSLPCAAQCRYEITAIIRGRECPFDPAGVLSWGMNEAGDVVGAYRCPLGNFQAYVWLGKDPIIDLPMPSGTIESMSYDVDAEGCVVGGLRINDEEINALAFFFDGQETQTLEILPGHDWSEALALSEDGTVVGWSGNTRGGPAPVPVVWVDGDLIDLRPMLGTPEGSANDIDDYGHVVGWRGTNRRFDARGFVFDLATGKVVDIGVVPGGTSGDPKAISNRGRVVGVGWRRDIKTFRSFLWAFGQMVDLGVLPGTDQTLVWDINDRGLIVGAGGHSNTVAFLWHEGVLSDLNDLMVGEEDITLRSARSINTEGQIAVLAHEDPGRDTVTVLLAPVDQRAGDVSGNCRVNMTDLLMVLSRWGSCADCFEDINGDGEVGSLDLLIVLADWG